MVCHAMTTQRHDDDDEICRMYAIDLLRMSGYDDRRPPIDVSISYDTVRSRSITMPNTQKTSPAVDLSTLGDGRLTVTERLDGQLTVTELRQ